MSAEVLLLEDVKNLGQSGQVIKVSDGYARNYLIPRHLAVRVSERVLAQAQLLAGKRKNQLEKELKEAEALRDQIEKLECPVAAKVGPEEKLYGSVTSSAICASLKKLGLAIDRRKIVISEPIKVLGTHTVSVKVHPQVEASLKVSVIRQPVKAE